MALASDLVAVGILSRHADMLGDTSKDLLTATGVVQATALPLTAAINEITTNNAGVADGVLLPLIAATPHSRLIVKNNAVGALKIYPNTGQSINALAVNVAYALAAGTGVTLCKVGSTRWITL